jgi:hypothetical protein
MVTPPAGQPGARPPSSRGPSEGHHTVGLFSRQQILELYTRRSVSEAFKHMPSREHRWFNSDRTMKQQEKAVVPGYWSRAYAKVNLPTSLAV